MLQKEVTLKYNEMLRHIRHSWVFQKNSMTAWQIMDQSMEKMKQLAHFAEDIGGSGIPPQLKPGRIGEEKSFGKALEQASGDTVKAGKRHMKLRKDSEFSSHAGMVINLDLTIQQEVYQSEEMLDIIRKKK